MNFLLTRYISLWPIIHWYVLDQVVDVNQLTGKSVVARMNDVLGVTRFHITWHHKRKSIWIVYFPCHEEISFGQRERRESSLHILHTDQIFTLEPMPHTNQPTKQCSPMPTMLSKIRTLENWEEGCTTVVAEDSIQVAILAFYHLCTFLRLSFFMNRVGFQVWRLVE